MSDEGFLARWSRRKRTAAAQADSLKDPPPKTPASSEPADTPSPEAPAALSLPSIESIQSGSDIAPFLAAGVPPELTRAALRRAWTADPAIRDFIGLSENAWDFTAPDGVPGFGSLDPERVRQLLEEVMGEPKAVDPTTPPATANLPGQPVADQTAPAGPPASEAPTRIAAVRCEETDANPRDSRLPRRHGGALPQ
jgi:hypothetical protein